MLASGTILQNRYHIVRPLGVGGMGAVYLAEDRRFKGEDNMVAVKENYFTKLDLRKAFEREANLLHRLKHPALPVVMDHFIQDTKQYLVMQFIPGKDIEKMLDERKEQGCGPFPVELTLGWADQLLDALEYLHGHRPKPIIHRDIKPKNLKLMPRRGVILLDFGLAKEAWTGVAQAGESLHGFSRHFAPLEQIQGTGTDARSDLYALGATTYYLLTGVIPPDAQARDKAVSAGLVDPLLPANQLSSQVPPTVSEWLSRALALSRDERAATATEMRRALREVSLSPALSISHASTFTAESEQEIEWDDAPSAKALSKASFPANVSPLDSTDNGQNTLSHAPLPLLPTVVEQPVLPADGIQVSTLIPLWSALAALFLTLAIGLAAVVARRFLGDAPDIVGVMITLLLGFLCLLAGSAFTQSGQVMMELGFSQLGIKLKFQGKWRMTFTFAILLIICIFFFSLPTIARFYNNERAVKFQQAGDLPAAIKNYKRAVSLDPDYAIAHYNLANAYEDVMGFDKAMAEYQVALLADPKFLFAYNNLARLYLTRRKDYGNALNILNAGLALNPEEPDTKYTLYKNRGWAHFGLGLYELAADDLREALRWRENGAAAHCLLAQVLEAQGGKDTALPEWAMCMAYAPGETDVEASWLSLARVALKQGGNQ